MKGFGVPTQHLHKPIEKSLQASLSTEYGMGSCVCMLLKVRFDIPHVKSFVVFACYDGYKFHWSYYVVLMAKSVSLCFLQLLTQTIHQSMYCIIDSSYRIRTGVSWLRHHWAPEPPSGCFRYSRRYSDEPRTWVASKVYPPSARPLGLWMLKNLKICNIVDRFFQPK